MCFLCFLCLFVVFLPVFCCLFVVYFRGYVKGEMKFTNHIRELFHCYRTGNIPGTWTSFVIVPENRKFVAYLTNLTERFQHVLQLTTKFVQQVDSIPTRIPKTIVFSLGQFFHPDAFLMASRQYAAQVPKELFLGVFTCLSVFLSCFS